MPGYIYPIYCPISRPSCPLDHGPGRKTLTMVSLVAKIISSCIAAWVIDLWIRYRKAVADVGYLPGLRLLFAPTCMIGNIIPRTRLISAGSGHGFQFKRTICDKAGMDIYSSVGLVPVAAAYVVSDPDALKQIFASRSPFKKHAYDYRALTIFGRNLLSAEGDEWRRQRRIAAPVFSEKNNRLVQSCAKGFVDQMTNEWGHEAPVHIEDVQGDITMQITLCIISKAGFGQDIEWGDKGEAPEGHQLTFKQALLVVSHNLHFIIMLPKWVFGWSKHLTKVRDAYEELRLYFQEMISSRRADNTPGSRIQVEEQYDLFNQIILAHDDNNTLSEEELIGNVFLFLFAGHETTANSLAFTLGLLALYPEEQRKVVEQIKELQKESCEFSYDDLPKYTHTLAALYEALRLYPIGSELPRRTDSDTFLTYTPYHTKEPTSLPIKNGSRIVVNIAGLHYNPKYWDDPNDFIPARFLDPNWNRDTFLPFLAGPRACIGRRFAETTAVTVLVRLLSKYTVTVDETRFKFIEGEPILSLRERFLGATAQITLTPRKFPLVFTPRK
ncbi:cytochrome P450 [Rhizoctonia solani]|nr:cytochrome P450 [Rhizoctonia solani]